MYILPELLKAAGWSDLELCDPKRKLATPPRPLTRGSSYRLMTVKSNLVEIKLMRTLCCANQVGTASKVPSSLRG